MQCKRKHILFDKQYFLYELEDQLIIGESLGKYKYSIKFEKRQKVDWKIAKIDGKLKLNALGLIYNGQKKWFQMNDKDLRYLWSILSKQTFFMNIEPFYSPLTVLGGGASCQVIQNQIVTNNKVFLVRSSLDNNLYANKCIRKSQDQRNQLQSIEQEISFLKYLNHPNIIQFKELFDGDLFYHIITEYIPGETLTSFVDQKKEELNQNLIKDIMRVIDYLKIYSKYLDINDIIHRDIKGDNILIYEEGSEYKIKIIDFGLATHAYLNTFSNPKCGTPGFMAPEVANLQNRQSTYTSKSDVFSAGVIFFNLLTGKNLFSGEDTQTVYALNKKCSITHELSKIQHTIDATAYNLLRRMLMIEPLLRIRASEALDHQYLQSGELIDEKDSCEELKISSHKEEVDDFQIPNESILLPQRIPQQNQKISLIKNLNFVFTTTDQNIKQTSKI